MSMSEPRSAPGRSVWWALLIVGFGWGTGGTMIRWLLGEGAEPFTLITMSTAIAAATLFAALLLSGQRLPNDKRTWRVGTVLAVTNVAAFGFFVFMVQNASAGFAGLLAGLSPLTTAAWTAYLFEDEELKPATLIGLLIGVAGLVVLALTRDSGLATVVGRRWLWSSGPVLPLPSGSPSPTQNAMHRRSYRPRSRRSTCSWALRSLQRSPSLSRAGRFRSRSPAGSASSISESSPAPGHS